MKQISFALFIALLLASCSVQRQSSSPSGLMDEVYFTRTDTRIKTVEVPNKNQNRQNSLQDQSAQNMNGNAGNYTNSYSNRLRHFGSSNRFNYNDYQPVLVPTMNYNPMFGWNMGLNYVDPRFGYIGGYNSPFSTLYGYNMPYYDPFFSYGWGNSWMTGYYPYYTYNPYFYNPCAYRYGFGNGYYNPGYQNYYYNNYNNNSGNNNGSSSSGNTNYSRRTGSSNNQPSTTTTTTSPQNSSSSGSSNNSGSSWYNGGNSDRGGSSSSGSSGGSSGSSGSSGSGSSGGNSDRGSSGNEGSTRRR